MYRQLPYRRKLRGWSRSRHDRVHDVAWPVNGGISFDGVLAYGAVATDLPFKRILDAPS
jgi:hypothetical protein